MKGEKKMTTEAQRRAIAKYQKGKPMVNVKFYKKSEIEDYIKIKNHCKNINITIQAYFKMLAKEDMKTWEK